MGQSARLKTTHLSHPYGRRRGGTGQAVLIAAGGCSMGSAGTHSRRDLCLRLSVRGGQHAGLR
jgi:hypothetical protein